MPVQHANQIPSALDGARVVYYLILRTENQPTGNTRHSVGGISITEFYGLAICSYNENSGYHLFYCDRGWNVLTDTYHDTLSKAKEQAAFEFTNTFDKWQQVSVILDKR